MRNNDSERGLPSAIGRCYRKSRNENLDEAIGRKPLLPVQETGKSIINGNSTAKIAHTFSPLAEDSGQLRQIMSNRHDFVIFQGRGSDTHELVVANARAITITRDRSLQIRELLAG